MPVDHGGRDDLNPQLLGLGLSAMLVPLGSTMIAVALPGSAPNSTARRASSPSGW